ncbi:unnamed protein product [Schistosoma margrebowiei]|uniref:Uncharacterized protein n=1 Tax=Schistosoma margrebowiei TaxID=48269 RepID=A0A183LLB2_9TREM|nr:unnamed protein product [Schistosoma margrebowiei]
MAFQLNVIIDKSKFIITNNTEAFSKHSECLCSMFVKLDKIFKVSFFCFILLIMCC